MSDLELSSLEEKLDSLALELLTKYNHDLQPVKPFIIVRVLPRDRKVGMIWTPDTKGSGNPVYEGIVLRTWEPYWKRIRSRKEDSTDEWIEREVYTQSEFKPGDHICFPHWLGQPLPFGPVQGSVAQEVYRAIPEGKVGNDEGPILGWINRPEVDAKQLLIAALDAGLLPDPHHESMAEKLLQEFDIVPKIKTSHVASGDKRE